MCAAACSVHITTLVTRVWRCGSRLYLMGLRRFIDYITSKFYTNARYTSSIFYILKFFFEKNTKHFHAVDKLGSVYRSSKWVGLKLRNVNSMSLFKWCLAAAFVFMLCYWIINPSGSIPTVAASAISVVTQSVWQLLQYWKVGSVTLLAATAKGSAELALSTLVERITSLLFGRTTRTATWPTPGSSTQEPDASVVGTEDYNSSGTPTQDGDNWTPKQHLVLPWAMKFYKLQKALSQSAGSCNSLSLGAVKCPALLYGLLSARYRSRLAHPTSLSLYTTVSSFLDEPVTELPYILETAYAIYPVQASHSASNLYRATFSATLNQGTLRCLTAPSERGVLANVGANLTLAKENRWLWRSNMFSNRLSARLNTLTQMRTYINNPLFSSLFLNKSIWLSTRVSDNADLQLLNLGDRSSASSVPLLTCYGGKSTQANLNFLGDSILWGLSRFSAQQSMHAMQHVSFTPAGGTKRAQLNSSYASLPALRPSPLFLDYNFATSNLHLGAGTVSPKWVYPTLEGGDLVADYTSARLEAPNPELLLRFEAALVLSGCFSSAPKKSLPFIYFSNL